MSMITIECRNIEKYFIKGKERLYILKKINFTAHQGQIIILMGPSGSGKSTLLSIIAGLITQDSGECLILNKDINHMPEKEKTAFRGSSIGFMFQNIKLIPTLTTVQNVAIPLILQQIPREEAFKKAAVLLSSFGLERDLHSFPNLLSGGEQQRVAIARACIHNPKIILCDEPTSFLDLERGKQIMDLLKKIKEEHHATVIVVTHDPRILSYADTILTIEDGSIKETTQEATKKTF